MEAVLPKPEVLKVSDAVSSFGGIFILDMDGTNGSGGANKLGVTCGLLRLMGGTVGGLT